MANKLGKFVLIAAGILTLSLSLGGCSDTSSQGTVLSDIMGTSKTLTPTQEAKAAFNVDDPDKRRQAVDAFSAAPFGGEKPYVNMYRLLLTDPDPTVRAACAKALGRHGTPADAVKIAKLLDDKSSFARWQAARALQRLHNPKVVGQLIKHVGDDKDSDVRMACAKALGQYAQPRVFSALVGALSDTNYGVVDKAAGSLETLTGYTKAGNSAGDWLRWQQANGRDLFVHRKQYTYTPYDPPPGIMDIIRFWKPEKHPAPQIPKGMEVANSSKKSSSSSSS